MSRKELRRLALGVGLALCCGSAGCGPTAAPTSPSPTTCTPSGPASSTWPSPSSSSGPAPTIVAANISGDTFKLTFGRGTPQFEVKPQSNTHFILDPSGSPLDLPGSAGATVVLRGFRGDKPSGVPHVPLGSKGPLLLQVNNIADFEGVVTWAAGLSGPGCAHVTAADSSLSFQFITQP